MRDCIYFTFNSHVSKPLENLILDAKPCFQIHLFDYSGLIKEDCLDDNIYNLKGTSNGELWRQECRIVAKSTEGKGQIIYEIASIIPKEEGYYIGIFDDDILIRVSDINKALVIAKKKSFASFQSSLANCSYFSHAFTLNHNHRKLFPIFHKYRYVPYVEIMMPIMKSELLISSIPFLINNISSFGLDCYVFPILAITNGISGGHAVIDASIATHIRQFRINKKIFSNGMTASQEQLKLKKDCMDYLIEKGIDWRRYKKLSILFKNKSDIKNYHPIIKRIFTNNLSIFKNFFKNYFLKN